MRETGRSSGVLAQELSTRSISASSSRIAWPGTSAAYWSLTPIASQYGNLPLLSPVTKPRRRAREAGDATWTASTMS
jgi:hypothetical protein